MTYGIRIDGSWTNQDTGKMFSRADMAFCGFSRNDVRPPTGYVLTFDTPHAEPVFIRRAIVRP